MKREDELEIMLAIAREAGEVIARIYTTDFGVEYKRPGDPVTVADREANGLIVSRLATHFADTIVVAEESAEASFAGWAHADRAFFVDPLDGTREFVAKNGEFAVMIGLAEQGRAVAGVVLAPESFTAWFGAVDLGAWEIDRAGVRSPIHVSTQTSIASARVVVTRSHRGPALTRALDQLAPAEIVSCGSAGLKAARVASGRADLYLQPGRAGKRWDACAPEAIVRAAGGRFTDGFGDAIDYGSGTLDNERGFFVSNGLLHDTALSLATAAPGA